MNEYLEKLKAWWVTLSEREQVIFKRVTIVVTCIFIYLFVWSPLVEAVVNARKKIVVQQKTLQWMKLADQQIKELQGGNDVVQQRTSPIMLLSMMQKQIQAAGLEQNVSELKQANGESIELNFQKVAFDTLVKFLLQLVKQQPITITQLSVVNEGEAGIVNAQLLLTVR